MGLIKKLFGGEVAPRSPDNIQTDMANMWVEQANRYPQGSAEHYRYPVAAKTQMKDHASAMGLARVALGRFPNELLRTKDAMWVAIYGGRAAAAQRVSDIAPRLLAEMLSFRAGIPAGEADLSDDSQVPMVISELQVVVQDKELHPPAALRDEHGNSVMLLLTSRNIVLQWGHGSQKAFPVSHTGLSVQGDYLGVNTDQELMQLFKIEGREAVEKIAKVSGVLR